MYALTLNLLVVKLPGLGVITFTPTGLMIALVIIGTIFILLRRQYLREGKRTQVPPNILQKDRQRLVLNIAFAGILLTSTFFQESGPQESTKKIYNLLLLIGIVLFVGAALLGQRSIIKGATAGVTFEVTGSWLLAGGGVALIIGIAGDLIDPESSKLIPKLFAWVLSIF